MQKVREEKIQIKLSQIAEEQIIRAYESSSDHSMKSSRMAREEIELIDSTLNDRAYLERTTRANAIPPMLIQVTNRTKSIIVAVDDLSC